MEGHIDQESVVVKEAVLVERGTACGQVVEGVEGEPLSAKVADHETAAEGLVFSDLGVEGEGALERFLDEGEGEDL